VYKTFYWQFEYNLHMEGIHNTTTWYFIWWTILWIYGL